MICPRRPRCKLGAAQKAQKLTVRHPRCICCKFRTQCRIPKEAPLLNNLRVAQKDRLSVFIGKANRIGTELLQIRCLAVCNLFCQCLPLLIAEHQIIRLHQSVLHIVNKLPIFLRRRDTVKPRQRSVLYAARNSRVRFAVKVPRPCKSLVRQIFNFKVRSDLRFHIRFCHIALFLQRVHIPSENPHQIFRGRCRCCPARKVRQIVQPPCVCKVRPCRPRCFVNRQTLLQRRAFRLRLGLHCILFDGSICGFCCFFRPCDFF